ncbi:MAG: gliding motility-associated C-terminal domain-containing protein [bacterium]|nr:gliding motility-associated C-terminal domain-containing protein [bacterium]
MKGHFIRILIFFFLYQSKVYSQVISNSTASLHENSHFISGSDIFGTRVFIKNTGQFNDALPKGEKVNYLYEHGGEKIYFTPNGLIYEFTKSFPLTEEQQEKKERGEDAHEKPSQHYFVTMNWPGSSADIEIDASLKQDHYITYGSKELNASCFKKIIYKNVYDHIDIEYCIPEDKEYGIKYNVILHPGADIRNLSISYSGDITKMKLLENGEIVVKTPLQDITEHAPKTYYEGGVAVDSKFELQKNIFSFTLPFSQPVSKTVIIDPWVTTVTTLASNNNAYDVDFDNNGNTFIYGGSPGTGGRCKVAKYNNTGILQWTFSGIILSPSWSSGSSWSSNFKIHKPSGKTYVGRHIVGPAGAIRLDAAGNYDNFMAQGGTPAMQELWHLEFACNGDLMAFLGNQYSGALISATTASVTQVSTFNSGITGCCQDILAEVVDGIGDLFVYFSGSSPLNNTISKIAPSYTSTVWNASSTFANFQYLQSKNFYVGGTSSNGSAVAFNALAVNMSFLYYYDGSVVAAYNKNNGSLVASTTVPGQSQRVQGGIAVDDCNNIYLGGNGFIRCYNFNGTAFSTLTPIALGTTVTSQFVYDLQLNKTTNLLHACGSEFVGTYTAQYSTGCLAMINTCSCIQPFLSVNTSSTNCVNIGSSTVNVGGMPGPYTYSWLPGGQTTSVITAMNPGSYTVAVTSTSCNVTTSAVTIFTSSLPPYSLSVPSTSITCANLGSATVATTGMPGPFSYTWLPTSQTSSVANGLSPGTYTLLIFSGGCNLTFSATTVFNSLIPLTANISYVSSVTCNAANTGTGAITNLAGGSGNQTFSWFNGITNYSTALTNSLSAGIWTANVTDALTGCQVYQSFFISQPAPLNINLSATSPTTCVGTSIVLTGTNSGGTPGYTYTWTAGPVSDTRTVTSAVAGTIVYTLSSRDSLNCLSTATISAQYIPAPTMSVPNTSICPLETGTLIANGATSYTWNTSATGNVFTANPITSQQYTVIGSALGCTSTATSSIIIKPLPTPFFTSNSPVCNGQNLILSASGGTAFIWRGPLSFSSTSQNTLVTGASPNNSGSYQLTVTAVNSCSASTSANLQVNPTPTISALGATVCSSQTLNLSSTSFPGSGFLWAGPLGFYSNLQNPSYANPAPNRSGLYTVTATSPVGCTNTAVAQVTVTLLPVPLAFSDGPKCMGSTINFSGTGGSTYSWIGPAGFNSNQQNPQINFVSMAGMGTYSLTVFTGPCVNSTSYSLTVYPLPNPAATNNGPVCETKTLNLFASTGNTVSTYSWMGPLFYSSNQNPRRDSSKLSFSGIYTLTVQDYHMCQASAQTTVVILQNPVVSASGATVCLYQPATLSANGASSFLWSGPAFYQSNIANAFIASVSPDRTGTYTVVGTAANSCTGTTTAKVRTRSLPSPSLTILPGSIVCLNDALTLNGGGGLTYQWYGPNSVYYEGQSVNFVASNLSTAGTYTLKVTDETGCAASIATLIVVNDLPNGNLIGTKMQGCVPLCSDFVFSTSSGNPNKVMATWYMNGRTLMGQKFTHCFTELGDNKISGSLFDSTTSCANKVDFFVKTFAKPEADFDYSPLKPIENTDEVIFTNTTRGEKQQNWNWYFSSTKGYRTNSQNTSYLFQEQGHYPVVLVVRNTWGCVDSVLKVIDVEEDFQVFVPNVFSPNDDNLNDVFVVLGRGIKYLHLSVYNRWGTIIFESKDQMSGWDGTYKGEPCKSDIYNWKLEVTSIRGESKNMTGHVSLIR